MKLIIRPLQLANRGLQTALRAGSPPGGGIFSGQGRVIALARAVQSRYLPPSKFGRFPARLSPLDTALRRAVGVGWQPAWHLHLAPRLELAILSAAHAGRPGEEPAVRRAVGQPDQPGSWPQAIQAIEYVVRLVSSAQPVVERLYTHRSRRNALDPDAPQQRNSGSLAPSSPLLPFQDKSRRPEILHPASTVARVLLHLAATPTATAPARVQVDPPYSPPASAFPQAGRGSHQPPLPLDQLPAHEVNRLADQVVQAIDRRILAQRERLGRV